MSNNFFLKNKGPFSIKKIIAISGSKNSFELDRKSESGNSAKVNTELVNSQADALEAKKQGIDIDSQEIKAESSRIEPPFIVALKEILERISRKEIPIRSARD